MSVFGDRLRREREMRGVTLDEIAESTKISRRSLEALEQEEFDLLPGGIFNKGFVRAYARYLGIDEEQAVADYVAACQEPQPADDKFPLEVHEDNERRPPLNEKRSFTPLILAVVALVLGVFGWTYWTRHKSQLGRVNADQGKPAVSASPSPSPVTSVPQQQVSAPVAVTTPSKVSTSEQNIPAPADSSPSGGDKKTASSGASSNDKNLLKLEQKNTPETAAQSQPVPEMKAGQGKSFKVSIKAREDSWYSVQKDGEPAIEGILKADKHKDFKAKQELVLKIGNAGGVEINHNGKPVGPLGEQGVARTLTFKSSGLEQ